MSWIPPGAAWVKPSQPHKVKDKSALRRAAAPLALLFNERRYEIKQFLSLELAEEDPWGTARLRPMLSSNAFWRLFVPKEKTPRQGGSLFFKQNCCLVAELPARDAPPQHPNS